MLSQPVITVAALQGHTFAAGAMLSLAYDFRVMRADRGFWCLPEADINIPFTPGMAALIRSRLAPGTAHEAMVTGRRYGGSAATAAGIVDRAVDEDAVRSTAVEIAESQLSKAGETLGTIKHACTPRSSTHCAARPTRSADTARPDTARLDRTPLDPLSNAGRPGSVARSTVNEGVAKHWGE